MIIELQRGEHAVVRGPGNATCIDDARAGDGVVGPDKDGCPWRVEIAGDYASIVTAKGEELILYDTKHTAFNKADLIGVLELICTRVNAGSISPPAPGLANE